MQHTLDDSHPVYFMMTVSGVVEKTGFIAALSELLNHPDYQAKHTMWDFTAASMGLSIGDLGEIAGVLKLFKPRTKDFANRSALVVPNLMEMSMARVYISISKLLPFHYKAFKNREDAIKFLTS